MKTLGSAAAVIAAMRDDAAAEIEKLERETASAIESLRVPAGSPAGDAARARQVDAARRTALDRGVEEAWQDARAMLTDREAWMASVVDAGARRLADPSDAERGRRLMADFIREAVPHLPGPALVVSAPAGFAAVLTDAWRRELETDTGRTLTLGFTGPAAGCIVGTPDGSVTFDNSVAARSRRSASEWRAALARLYEDAVRQHEGAQVAAGEAV